MAGGMFDFDSVHANFAVLQSRGKIPFLALSEAKEQAPSVLGLEMVFCPYLPTYIATNGVVMLTRSGVPLSTSCDRSCRHLRSHHSSICSAFRRVREARLRRRPFALVNLSKT